MTGESTTYQFAGCVLDLQRREVLRDGRGVPTQPKVFDLLVYLVENRDRVVDKDELLAEVWSGTVVSETSLSQSIRKARALVGDDGERQDVIKTVQRRGYRFVADLFEDEPTPSIAVAPAAAPEHSIAVLPFANMSSDAENEYFADGLAEELLNLLARVPMLHVAARTSSFAFRDTRLDVRAIGQRLNVAHVLEGSVRKAGNRIRVTAQLIEAATGYHLASQTFDETLDDIFQVQDDISAAVVQHLMPKLFGGEVPSQARINPAAYNLYLQGRHAYRQTTRESFEAAIKAFQQALEIDPGLAVAWDLLGMVYIRQGDVGIAPVAEANRRGREAIERAVEIDPSLVEGHAHLAWISMTYDWDFPAAQAHIDRALALDPRNYAALAQAGALAFVLGGLTQSVSLREQALSMDPVGRGGHHNLGSALLNGGRYEESEAVFLRALSISPDYIGGWFYCGLPVLLGGDPGRALDVFSREVDEAWRLEGQSIANWLLGNTTESDEQLKQLVSRFGDDMVYQMAEVHSMRGEVDEAFAWLDRAYTVRDGGLVEMLTNPLLAHLHQDERWTPLLARVGLIASR